MNPWAQKLNFIKNLKEALKLLAGFELKTIAYLGLLIYWATMLTATFSQ